jgi:hypothetical protein
MYEKLPIVNYLTPSGVRRMTDITVRFNVEQSIVDRGAYPLNVTINETDRPDIVAHRVYKDSYLHWAVLNINDMVNPYYDWILSSVAFDNYMQEKYPGYTVFLTSVGGLTAFEGSFKTNDIVYATGVSSADAQPSILNSLMNARVVEYDPQYCKLVIDLTQKTAWVPAENDLIAGANTNALGETTYYVAKIGKVVSTQYALHHFENSDGEMLNPRIPASLHGEFLTASSFSGFTFGATPIGRYILEDNATGVVTNREHEERLNDEKRNIVLVDPVYMSNINADIESFLER